MSDLQAVDIERETSKWRLTKDVESTTLTEARVVHRSGGKFSPAPSVGLHEDHDHDELSIKGPHRHYNHSQQHSHSSNPRDTHDHPHSHAHSDDIRYGSNQVHLPNYIHSDHGHRPAGSVDAEEHGGHANQKVHGSGKGGVTDASVSLAPGVKLLGLQDPYPTGKQVMASNSSLARTGVDMSFGGNDMVTVPGSGKAIHKVPKKLDTLDDYNSALDNGIVSMKPGRVEVTGYDSSHKFTKKRNGIWEHMASIRSDSPQSDMPKFSKPRNVPGPISQRLTKMSPKGTGPTGMGFYRPPKSEPGRYSKSPGGINPNPGGIDPLP